MYSELVACRYEKMDMFGVVEGPKLTYCPQDGVL